MSTTRQVYIVDGARTPFIKAPGKPNEFTGSDLAVWAGRSLLQRQNFLASDLDEVVIGSTMPSPDEPNIGRVIAMRLGCGNTVPAWTVMRNCASGLQALDSAYKDILSGRHQLVLAGGTDAMSRAPLLFGDKMVNWLASWYAAKSFGKRLKVAGKFRPQFLAPVIALLKGLTDPIIGLNMGQTAEKIAYRFDISREEQDAYAVESHVRLAQAQDNKHLSEIVPIYDSKGNVFEFDNGIRRDSSTEKLSTLKPFFDKKFGKVTAGNSSQITDGSALMILASKEAVKKHKLPVIGKIVDVEWAGLDPSEMGLGPVYAMTPILQRHGLSIADIDNWEINEAFAAQLLGCLKAWEDDDYCKTYLGLNKALGSIDPAKLNVDGGAIALGHPVGASGARIVLHTLNALHRTGGKYGMASLCIGGGQGGAMLVEKTTEVA